MSVDKLLNATAVLSARLFHAENEFAQLAARLEASRKSLEQIGTELGQLRGELAAREIRREPSWEQVAASCPPI